MLTGHWMFKFFIKNQGLLFLIAFEMFTQCNSKITYLKEVDIKLLSYELEDKLILYLLMKDLCS